MTTGPYAHAWEAYRAAGWAGPIPLPPRRKANPPSGVTGDQGMWPSYADCHTWAEGPEGKGNIALRLPHNVVGIDVDAYDGKPGQATFAAAIDRYGPLPATWTSTARHDGTSRISLYRIPEGLAWPGELGPAVELIQVRHRYAVVWPSIHPEGGTYQWYGPDGAPCGPPDVDHLAPLPDPWIAGLTGGQEAAAPTPRMQWDTAQARTWLITRPRASDPPCKRMAAALADAQLALAAGASAHATTTSAVMRTVRLADEGHAGSITTLTQLHDAFTANTTNPGRSGTVRTLGQAENEWRRALDSAAAKVAATTTRLDACDCDGRLTQAIVDHASAHNSPAPAQPDPSTPQPDQTQPDPTPPQTSPHTAVPDPIIEDQIRTETLKIQIREEARRRARREQLGAQDPPTLVDLGQFLSIEDEPQQYRIEGLWPVGGRVLLTAQFKAGKTTLIGNLVRALLDGEPFLGRFLTHAPTGRIAIVDNELDDRMLRRWLRDQNIANPTGAAVMSLRGRLSTFDLLDPEVRDQWAARFRAAGTTILLLDCLAPILDALALSEDKEAGRFLVALDEMAKEAGIQEIVLVHHMGHNAERARGASRLRDWPDVEWRLVREKGEENEDNPAARRYFSAYGRDVDVAEAALDYHPPTRHLALVAGSRQDTAGADLRAAVITYLRANPGSAGRQVELFAGHPQKKTRDALKALVATNEVTATPHRGAILYSVAAPSISLAEHPPQVTAPPTPIRQDALSISGSQGTETLPLGNTPDLPAEPKPQVNDTPRQLGNHSATTRQNSGEALGNGDPLRGWSPELPSSATSATQPPNTQQDQQLDPRSPEAKLNRVRDLWAEEGRL